LELIGCKVLAGFVLEKTDEQLFTVISLATGKKGNMEKNELVQFRQRRISSIPLSPKTFLDITNLCRE
jgi:hypothetical protein